MFLEAYHWRMGRCLNMNQSSRAAAENFVFLKAANNGSLKTNCCFEPRARWNALARNWPASRQKNGFFEVWPVGLIFFIFTSGDCTCFCEEKKKLSHAQRVPITLDRGLHEDFFAVCPETRVALDTANLVTFFADVCQKCTIFFLVQPGPNSRIFTRF